MKPKYNWMKKSLPVVITIALAAPFAANAAIFNDDTGGNANPSAVDNGETTIIADGGTSLTPFVNIGSSVNLNGQNDQTAVLVVSGANPYTITVASGGMLAANSSQDGINSTSVITLTNSGTISGFGGGDGIETVGGGSSITNNGAISSPGSDAIVINSDTATITNSASGTITADNDGIDANSGDFVTVNNNGSISGGADGVDVSDSSTVNNNTNFSGFFPISGGSITGDDNGIEAGNLLTVKNYNLATISGGSDGINAGDSANITNFAGGTITGSADGIDVGNDLLLSNSGSITGTESDGVVAENDAEITNFSGGTITGGDDGIDVENGATIFNNAGATITGGDDGISAGTNLNLTNNGLIQATGMGADDGVSAGLGSSITNGGTISGDYGVWLYEGGATVTNTGTITGTSYGIAVGSAADVTVTNSGLISGPDSFDGSGGNDTLNLNLGSRLVGDVTGGSGTNTIYFNGGLTSSGSAPDGSSSNSILGDVTEFDSINKSGSGVAFIGVPGNGGYDVEVDTINITSGGLYVNGDIFSDDGEGGTAPTTINAGGAALGGTGIWNANIAITAGGISAGAIPINLTSDPTEAVGTLNIVGNVTHSSGTFIRHDVIPNGADDLINHSGGTYDLGGNSVIRVSATTNDTVIRDGTYTVVDSDSFINGDYPTMAVQFNPNVNGNDNGLIGSLTYDTGVGNTSAVLNRFMYSDFTNGGTNLVFVVNHDFEGLPGLNSNESALGAALDDSIDSPNAQIQDFIAALDYSDLGTVQDTLASLIPDHVLGAASGLVGANYRLHRVVEDHLAMTRNGGTIVETPASTDAKGGIIPAQVTSTGGGAGNIWGTVSYDWRDSDFGTTDIDGEDASFTVGADYRVAPNLLIGILADGTQSSYDHPGGDSDTDSYRFAAYGTYGESTGLYADFLVAYGNHDLDSSRKLGGLLAGYSSNSSTDADSLQAMLTVGYTMDSGCVKHGPFAGLEYQNINVDGFTTSGSGAFGSVGDFDIDSLRLLVGYRAQATYGSFTPFGSVAYAHEFEDGAISATATIPGGATYRFNGGGVDSAILVTLGTSYSFTDSLSANLTYHGEISTGDGADSHGVSLGLNYGF